MDFKLSDDHLLIQDTAREFARKELAPHEETFPLEHLEKLAELGFLGFLIPEEYGGAGLGNVALALALEEINCACASTGVTISVHNSLVAGLLARHGTEEQKREFLPRLSSGELLGAYAMTEPGHGSDAAGMETRAVRNGDTYVLNGRKSWITSGAMAGLVIVFATVDPAKRSRGITAFLVDPKNPGFVVGGHEKKLGIRGSQTVELVFEDLEVAESMRIGEEGKGFGIAMDSLDGGRIGIASQAIGIARACLESSRKYALERKQFGTRIADFQPIQWKIARMATGIEAARGLVRRAAWLRDRAEPHTREAAMAKLLASEVANQAAPDAVQIHGGAGYCKAFPVERFFRDAKITEIYEGTSEIQHLVIAREVLNEVTV